LAPTRLHSGQCSATTARGERCRRPVVGDLDVCTIHNGAAVGAPTIFNEELGARVVQVLRAGGYLETAAAVAGVSRRRLNEWLRKGDPAGANPRYEPFRRWRERVESAKAEAEARNVALIAQAATSNWQAAAWLLERLYPERWARPSQREGAHEAPVAVTDQFADIVELADRRRPTA
jgi:hypothetical protein